MISLVHGIQRNKTVKENQFNKNPRSLTMELMLQDGAEHEAQQTVGEGWGAMVVAGVMICICGSVIPCLRIIHSVINQCYLKKL